jgi:hypothetical protein
VGQAVERETSNLPSPLTRFIGRERATGVRYIAERDGTAVFLDARDADTFALGSLPGARRLPLDEVTQAKDDGRLPMDDHNTRVVVVGADEHQARALAERCPSRASPAAVRRTPACSSADCASDDDAGRITSERLLSTLPA